MKLRAGDPSSLSQGSQEECHVDSQALHDSASDSAASNRSTDSDFVHTPRSFCKSYIPSLYGTKLADMILELRDILTEGADSRPIDLLDKICRTLEITWQQRLHKKGCADLVDCAVQIDIDFDAMRTIPQLPLDSVEPLESDDETNSNSLFRTKSSHGSSCGNEETSRAFTFSQHQWQSRQVQSCSLSQHAKQPKMKELLPSPVMTPSKEMKDKQQSSPDYEFDIARLVFVSPVHRSQSSPADASMRMSDFSDKTMSPSNRNKQQHLGLKSSASLASNVWDDSILFDLAQQDWLVFKSDTKSTPKIAPCKPARVDGGCMICRKAAARLGIKSREIISDASSDLSASVTNAAVDIMVCGGCGCTISASPQAKLLVDRRLCL